MDVASRACTLALAIGATHVNILSASISKIQNFIFSIQACLKVTFHVRTHARGAIVVHEILNVKGNLFVSNPIMCNLGEFLKKLPLETNKKVDRFGGKYVFIK